VDRIIKQEQNAEGRWTLERYHNNGFVKSLVYQTKNRMKQFLALVIVLATLDFSVHGQEKPPGYIICTSAAERLYTGSPSILVLSNGDYLASHDFFGPKAIENGGLGTTRIFVSKDKGKNWSLRTTIQGQFWSTLFQHKGSIYIFGTRGGVNDCVIRRSNDMGQTWTEPKNSETGLLLPKNGNMGYHCAPMPVTIHAGRIWRAFEYTPDKGWGQFQSLMLSADTSADLLDAKSWTSSNRLAFETNWQKDYTCWLEGNAVVSPSKQLVNILRVNFKGDDIAALTNVSEDGTKISFNPKTGFIDLPGGCKKFSIRYDSVSKRYWSLANYAPIAEKEKAKSMNHALERARNTLVLISSEDLIHWKKHFTVLYSPDIKQHGFQYADWTIEKNDIIAAVRTAYGEKTDGSHDANHITFHRIQDFRKKLKKEIAD
jgi:hypothetical protein